jgi:hypothetical protein
MKCRYASSIPYLNPYKSSRYEEAKIALARIHAPLSDPRDSFKKLGLIFKIQKKTFKWIVEQKEVGIALSPVLTFNSPRQGGAKKPHR